MKKTQRYALWISLLALFLVPDVSLSEEIPVSGTEPDLADFSPIPSLKIRGFGDFSFYASKEDREYESEFYLGNISLLITSNVNTKVSFLGELAPYRDVYYLERTNPGFLNSSYFEFQRFTLKYLVSDSINFKIGRYHTALGYWNQTYHHGTWLQPSILRPEILRFEFQGGILPEHSVGVEYFGYKVIPNLDVKYHLGVSNGRGKKLWVVQNFKDENRSKALSVFLSAEPHSIEGLRFGMIFYLDTVPPDSNDSGQLNPTDERIYGGHFIYLGERAELLSEFFKMYHMEENTGQDYVTEGGYVQANLKLNGLITFYRYDFIDFAENNPVFWGFHKDVRKHTIGVRWDVLPWNALKFELGRLSKKGMPPEYILGLNSSFTF